MPSKIERVVARHRRELADREQAAVERLHNAHIEILRTLERDLDAMTARIEEALAAGERVNPDWLRRQERYHRLIEQVERAYADYEPQVTRTVIEAKREAIGTSRGHALERAEAVGLRPATWYASLNTPALEALTAALRPDSPLRGVIGSHGPRAVEVIERELIAGMGRGSGAAPIVRAIRDGLAGDVDLVRVRALVRTEMLRSYTDSLSSQFASLGYGQKVWMASLSSRTCLACLARHGKVYPVDYVMDKHVNCRCSWAPYSGRNPGILRSIGDGETFVRSLDPATQRAMIGSEEAYAAFRDGGLTLQDFVGHTHSDAWGPAIHQRSGRSALAAAKR